MTKTLTAELRNVADWLMKGCDPRQAAIELRILAQQLDSAVEPELKRAYFETHPHCPTCSCTPDFSDPAGMERLRATLALPEKSSDPPCVWRSGCKDAARCQDAHYCLQLRTTTE